MHQPYEITTEGKGYSPLQQAVVKKSPQATLSTFLPERASTAAGF